MAGLPTILAFGNATVAEWTRQAHDKFDAAANAFLAQKVRKDISTTYIHRDRRT